MNKRGRPRKLHVKLKNGFYIEVCDIGFNRGMKIRRDSKLSMEDAARQYTGYKKVLILGEFRNGVPVIVQPAS